MHGGYTDSERTGNYIKDHWLGNLPLPLSYWINGSLISGVSAALIVAFASEVENSNASLQSWALAILALNFVAIAIWVWGIVGIWRSASRHEQRGGSPAWATVAKFMVVIGSLNVAGQLSTSSLQLIETSKLAAGSDPIGDPAKLSVNGQNAVLDGWITVGTAERFKSLLDANPQIDQLTLSSLGGRIREAEQIATLARDRKLSTVAEGNCASACTMIFLASNDRSLGANSALGFHSPGGVGVSDEEARATAPAMRAAYENAGLPSDFIDKALNTPSSSMWQPSEAELIDSGAVKKFAPSRIAQNHSLEIENLRKNGPIKIDDYTKAIKAHADGSVLTITYAVSLTKNEIDWESVSPSILKDSQTKLCSDNFLKTLVISGAVYRYVYLDKNGASLGTLTVSQCP
ncbi:MAG: hypothetical protein O9283_10995 [Sphingomonadaceae bacterium]|nr:hypothetical protein [Sphingomonadaceae bacterium]